MHSRSLNEKVFFDREKPKPTKTITYLSTMDFKDNILKLRNHIIYSILILIFFVILDYLDAKNVQSKRLSQLLTEKSKIVNISGKVDLRDFL